MTTAIRKIPNKSCVCVCVCVCVYAETPAQSEVW